MEGARRLSPSRKEVHVATLATATVFLALALPAPLLAQATPSNVPPARDPRIHAIAGAPQADRIERDIRTLVGFGTRSTLRSEEHTSELQSRPHLVCRLLLEKKNIN